MCGGDFNEIVFNFEKVRGPQHSSSTILNFHLAFDDCDLSDLGYVGSTIT